MTCRHCNAPLDLTLIDLGSAPPSNAYLTHVTIRRPEKWFPLKVRVCRECWLVQAEMYSRAAELFNDEYAYFSSFSSAWLEHAQRYAREMTQRFQLGPQSRVVEVASNDGYLLQYFNEMGIPSLGIEPTSSTAAASRQKGIETLEQFFDRALAEDLVKQGKQADLMTANNVLAHVPDINAFVAGFACLLKPEGVATFEFPHLMQLIEHKQFDTIYHEHFSYLSFTAVHQIFRHNGLAIFDVEELGTHGGSLRVFAQRGDAGPRRVEPAVEALLDREQCAGMRDAAYYEGFQEEANRVKRDVLAFLIEARRAGKRVGAYGAAAKGNTLLNYAGVRPDLLPYVVDKNPAKQGKFMPGSRIPIYPPEHLMAEKPDYVLILPWNLAKEVQQQNALLQEYGTQFVIAIPSLQILKGENEKPA